MTEVYPIPDLKILSIGRNLENSIVLMPKDISSYHAKLIICSINSFIIEDLGSKNGTFVDGLRITRKLIDLNSKVTFASKEYTIFDLIKLQHPQTKQVQKTDPLDFTTEFEKLKNIPDQYEDLKIACRNKEKTIRLWSVVASAMIGVGAIATSIGTGGIATLVTTGVVAGSGSVSVLSVLSSMGLSMLIPSLSSELLSTDEKLRLLEKEFRQIYRCPNPDCGNVFGGQEWKLLAKQKKCRSCKAIWVK